MEITNNAITIAKTLLGITDTSKDNILVAIGSAVEADVVKINTEILEDEYLLARMIQANMNRLNSEGLASQSLATVSESYISGNAYPDVIRNALRGYTKLKTL